MTLLFRIFILFCGTALALVSWPAQRSHAAIVDRIVAVVNDDIISLFELNRNLRPYQDRVRSLGYSAEKEAAMLYKVRGDVLNKLIDETLTDQEIRRTGIQVPEDEVDAAIERIKSSHMYTDEDLREGLAREGMTYEEYRRRIKEQILRSRMVTREVKSRIVITDEDIRAYYEAHPADYRMETWYTLRHILLRTDDPSSPETPRKRMETIIAAFRSGKSFGDLAREYSEAPSADDGGKLGKFSRSQLAGMIQDALEGREQGEITDPVDTGQGLQIFFIAAKADLPGKNYEKVRSEIEEKLYKEVVDKRFAEWLKELRDRSHIRIIQ